MRKIVLLGLVLILTFNLIGCGSFSTDADFDFNFNLGGSKEKKYDTAEEYLYDKYGKEFTLISEGGEAFMADTPYIYADENGNEFSVMKNEIFMDDYGHVLFDKKISASVSNNMPLPNRVFVDTAKAYTSASRNAQTYQEYLEMVSPSVVIYVLEEHNDTQMIISVLTSEFHNSKAFITICEVDEETFYSVEAGSDLPDNQSTYTIENGRIVGY